VCPTTAIRLAWDGRYGYDLAMIPDRCNDCGLCEQVCPGPAVDFQQLANRFLDGDKDDPRLGRFRSCHVGHARDEGIRWDAASGGIVTALLGAGLREGLFDGAVVTCMKPGSPLEPIPIVATTGAEIRAAAGSKYCPVPANLRLREILDTGGRFAFVGLPCHIHGLRLAQTRIPRLREKIAVCISLFCGLNMSPLGTRVALRRRQLALNEVKELRYRGNGWPGDLQVRLQGGQTYREHLYSYFGASFSAYEMARCDLCSDAFGELADLSCGDAWLPEYVENDDQGTSVVLVRSKRGEEILAAVGGAVLDLGPLPLDKAVQSQKPALLWKKDRLQAKASLARLAGRQPPTYVQDLPAPRWNDYVAAGGQIVARSLHRQWHRIRGFDR
jgi:coenzyme F420 hydrogenase subunit beta